MDIEKNKEKRKMKKKINAYEVMTEAEFLAFHKENWRNFIPNNMEEAETIKKDVNPTQEKKVCMDVQFSGWWSLLQVCKLANNKGKSIKRIGIKFYCLHYYIIILIVQSIKVLTQQTKTKEIVI